MKKAAALACAAALLLCACAKEALVTIDGAAVPDGYVTYAIELTVNRLASGGGGVDMDYARGEALTLLVNSRAVNKQAAALGLALSKTELEVIDADMSDIKDNKAAYRFFNYEYPALTQRLLDYYFGQGAARQPTSELLAAFCEAHYVRAVYLYLSLIDDDGYRLTGEELERMRLVAERLRASAAAGEDFVEIVGLHGQDYNMAVSPEGRVFPRYLFGPEPEAAMSALVPGQISPVAETHEGLFVFMLLPEPPEADEEELRYEYTRHEYIALLEQWAAAMDVQVSPGYWQLTVNS